MQRWEYSDIDQVFKQAAENAVFPYDPGNWDALEARITLADKKTVMIKIISAGSLAILLGIAGYLTFNGESIMSVEHQLSSKSDQVESSMPDQEESAVNDNTLSAADDPVQNEVSNPDNSTVEEVPTHTNRLPDNSAKGLVNETNRDILGERLFNEDDPLVQNQFVKDTGGNIQSPTENDHLIIGPISEETPNLGEYNPFHFKNSELPNQSLNISSLTLPLNQIDEATEEDIITSKHKTSGRFSLGFSLAPDYSGVSFKGNKAGFGLGATVSYNLSNRLSVVTGGFYSKKVYEIRESGYGSYNRLWRQIQEPDQIDASCHVIEIPVNLRLDLISMDRSNVFISSGLSTYFMMTEDYLFTYSREGPNAIPGINVKGENNHVFSIYNLSLGIQRRLTDRFGIEIEPYIKIPFEGIGVRDVNLTSSGTFITGRYFFR